MIHPQIFDSGALIFKVQPEVGVLFIRNRHRLRIKALLFSGSVIKERSSSALRALTHRKSAQIFIFTLCSSNPASNGDFTFIRLDFKYFCGVWLLFGPVKGDLIFTHLSGRFLLILLNS